MSDIQFAPDCKISYRNPVPVTRNFDKSHIIGAATVHEDGTATVELLEGGNAEIADVRESLIGFEVVRQREEDAGTTTILEIRLLEVSL